MVASATSELTRLTGLEPGDFGARYWGRTPLLVRAAERPDDGAEDFSLAAVDELLADRGLRTPFLRMARDGKTLPESRFTAGGGVGAGIADQISEDKVRGLFAEGATIVLQGLHRTWPPVIDRAQRLAAELGHPVQVNCYVTPPQNQGFSAHYDVHDVFVVQVHGTKLWQIHEPVLPQPLREQPWNDRAAQVAVAAEGPTLMEVVLEPGDCLYLPRGFIHAAQARGEISAHLTVGVHTWTVHHLAEALSRRMLAATTGDGALRASLPAGIDITDPEDLAQPVERARAALIEALRRVPAAEIAALMEPQARLAQRPAPQPPLAQLAAAERLGEADRLVLRPGLLPSVRRVPDGVEIISQLGRFTAAAYIPQVFDTLASGPASVRDLVAAGAELEGLRMLVRHGFVEVAGR